EARRLNILALNLEESAAVSAQRAELLSLQDSFTENELPELRARRSRAEAEPPRTARDHYWLASEYLAKKRASEALPLVQKATRPGADDFLGVVRAGRLSCRPG